MVWYGHEYDFAFIQIGLLYRKRDDEEILCKPAHLSPCSDQRANACLVTLICLSDHQFLRNLERYRLPRIQNDQETLCT